MRRLAITSSFTVVHAKRRVDGQFWQHSGLVTGAAVPTPQVQPPRCWALTRGGRCHVRCGATTACDVRAFRCLINRLLRLGWRNNMGSRAVHVDLVIAACNVIRNYAGRCFDGSRLRVEAGAGFIRHASAVGYALLPCRKVCIDSARLWGGTVGIRLRRYLPCTGRRHGMGASCCG